MATIEDALSHTIATADRIVLFARQGELELCADWAWRAAGVCERAGAFDLGRAWRRHCDALDGPGYATTAHWVAGAQRIRTSASVALRGLDRDAADRCHVCDRPDCARGKIPRCTATLDAMHCELCAMAERAAAKCAANAVDWRARALAAEVRQ